MTEEQISPPPPPPLRPRPGPQITAVSLAPPDYLSYPYENEREDIEDEKVHVCVCAGR